MLTCSINCNIQPHAKIDKNSSNAQDFQWSENSKIAFFRFYLYFRAINQTDDIQEYPATGNLKNMGNILNSKITSAEINKCIDKLKNDKAPAEDKLLNVHIKSTKESFLPMYEKLFNVVFDSGVIPNTWFEGTIRLIYKSK